MSKKLEKIIGIDLGTTTTVVSVYDSVTKQNTVIDINGLNYLPSVVGFKVINGKAIPVNVGLEAINNAIANPHNTVYNSKRFFALSESDILPSIPAGVKNHRILTHQALIDTAAKGYKPLIRDGKVMIEIIGDSGEKVYITPVDVAVALLQTVKKQTLHFFNVNEDEATISAVITVPAYFNNYQREEVKHAGEMAGLNVLRIINEPTAAALSRSDQLSHVKNLLVVDLGGGTFDVSLLQTDKEEGDAMTMEVKCTEGHLALGGADFDHAIADWILAEADKLNLTDHNGRKIDLHNNKETLTRLMELAEKVKKILSDKEQANINLSTLDPRISSQKNLLLTRNKFNQLIEPKLNEMRDITNSVLQECKVDKNDITMLLTGGSTRVPAVIEVFKSFGIKLLPMARPDQDVSYGASKLASSLIQGNSDVLLIDVTSVSLGIETLGGVFTPVITRNTPIPTKQTQVFSTAADNQTAVTIRVYQGERAMAKDNRFLDQFELSNIPPAPRGVPVIEVTFALDANGIVNVSAREKNTNQEAKITVNSTMKAEDLKKMQENAENFKAYDEQMQKNIQLRNTADNKVYEAQKMLKEHEAKLSEELKTEIQNAIKAVEEEMQKHSDITTMEYEPLEQKANELSNAVMKIYEHISKQAQSEQPSASEEAQKSE